MARANGVLLSPESRLHLEGGLERGTGQKVMGDFDTLDNRDQLGCPTPPTKGDNGQLATMFLMTSKEAPHKIQECEEEDDTPCLFGLLKPSRQIKQSTR